MVHFPKSLDFASSTVGMVYANGHSMALSVAGGDRMRASVLRMQRDRAWDAPRGAREATRPDRAGKGRTSFDDVAVVVCFLALIGIAVLGGALMLLSWITATVPVDPRIACSELDDCAVTASDKNEAVLVDDDWVY